MGFAKPSKSTPIPVIGLFVGVERYRDPYIRNLFNCKEDAEELYKLFVRPDIEKSNCVLLTDESATRKEILESLVRQMETAGEDDLLLLFVSTHGIIEYNDYFFFPHDAELNNILGTGISASLLINGLATSARKRNVKALMIFDTCHSGAIGFDYTKLSNGVSCLFSSSPSELSYERFDEEHGVFTKALLEGLRKEASNEEGIIDVRGLYNYIYRKVQRSTNKLQNPVLIGNLDDRTVLRTIEPKETSSRKEQLTR